MLYSLLIVLSVPSADLEDELSSERAKCKHLEDQLMGVAGECSGVCVGCKAQILKPFFKPVLLVYKEIGEWVVHNQQIYFHWYQQAELSASN